MQLNANPYFFLFFKVTKGSMVYGWLQHDYNMKLFGLKIKTLAVTPMSLNLLKNHEPILQKNSE